MAKALKARFAKMRKAIRKGDACCALELLEELQEHVEGRMAAANVSIHTANRELMPFDKRYIEVVPAEGSTHRLTINTVDGRITMKVSQGASPEVRDDLESFANMIKDYDKFLPVVYRGKVRFKHGAYRASLSTNARHIKDEHFIMEVAE